MGSRRRARLCQCMTSASANERTLHHRRRINRQREEIWEILASLPEPFGIFASKQQKILNSWLFQADVGQDQAEMGGLISWNSVPAACDPCKLLDHKPNRGKKHGKTILEQIEEIEYSQGVASADEVALKTTGVTQVKDSRGLKKRWQVESFVAFLRPLLQADPDKVWHIVDFGCGTGSLLLPLACLFPHCKFTGVEMKPAALAILNKRATEAKLANVFTFVGMIEDYHDPFDVALALHACGNATDVALLKAVKQRAAYMVSPCCVGKLKFSMHGGTSFSSEHRTWCSLPRMSGAEEEVRRAGEKLLNAAASRVPAGEGRLMNHSNADVEVISIKTDGIPRSHDSAGSAGKMFYDEHCEELCHPRSQALTRLLPDPSRLFKLIAQFADTNFSTNDQKLAQANIQSPRSTASAIEIQAQDAAEEIVTGKFDPYLLAQLSKLHVEIDRSEAAREKGYGVGIFKMFNAEMMAKGDLLVGVPDDRSVWHSISASILRS
ncbi:hypothetical protein CEUSTIGMA_g2887.t1 [Chlamydomonas eustigma]|uniref:Methyltransferase domain-containing protein n=1 Tax=Chlamydomonas eustigma TaxID=1157962 RepID=A0A250WX74_9CHLO|nr:hypothetical protein CEUSTIGMA_g2887.t1 [Chlamydomonas eustigma]|eukprot:GAX75443.1 hypothetical protein CEUSTIGMA_g2887.t1 [Chlamydomonas eustigma]